MAVDRTFVNGIIAVKENSLLRDKILKMCEGSLDDAFRTLSESGFCRGEELSSVYEYERALLADERDTDAFIREYSPSKAVTEYLFSPRDYHNAKAIVKAEHLKCDPSKMLAPNGIYAAEEITACVRGEKTSIDKRLKAAIEEAQNLSQKEGVTGAEIGLVFDRALNAHLLSACKSSPLLKSFLKRRSDMTDILTVMRSATKEQAEANLFLMGKLTREKLLSVFTEDEERAQKAMDGTPLKDFWRTAFAARSKGLPLTEGERALAALEEAYLKDRKYSLSGGRTFLYYIFRRRAENQNVRIVLSCLIAGMDGEKIKQRLRSFD